MIGPSASLHYINIRVQETAAIGMCTHTTEYYILQLLIVIISVNLSDKHVDTKRKKNRVHDDRPMTANRRSARGSEMACLNLVN